MLQRVMRFFRKEDSLLSKSRRLSAMRRSIESSAENTRKRAERSINSEDLEKAKKRLAELSESLDELRRIGKQHEANEASLRELIKVYEELTVPALVASHQTLVSRWEAEALVNAIGPKKVD